MTQALLDIYALDAALKSGKAILRNVTLKVGAGEIHGLVGESGAGKTSIAKAILGILSPTVIVTGGVIKFDGDDLLRADDAKIRGLLGTDITLIPQDPLTALNPSRRIRAQLTDGLVLKLGLSKPAALDRARSLLDDVHITDPERVLRSYPHELSGGMRQRVLIAQAFAPKPRLIIADEPTTALDVTVQKQILRLIRALQREHGTSVVFVTHDLGVVAQICDRVTVLREGEVMEQADVNALFSAPQNAYTRALLDAIPRYDRPGERRQPIPSQTTLALLEQTPKPDTPEVTHG